MLLKINLDCDFVQMVTMLIGPKHLVQIYLTFLQTSYLKVKFAVFSIISKILELPTKKYPRF